MHQQNCEVQTTVSEYTGCEYAKRPNWFTGWTLLHVWAPRSPSSRCKSSAGRLPARTAQALLYCCWSISAAPLSAFIVHLGTPSSIQPFIAHLWRKLLSQSLKGAVGSWPECFWSDRSVRQEQKQQPLFRLWPHSSMLMRLHSCQIGWQVISPFNTHKNTH